MIISILFSLQKLTNEWYLQTIPKMDHTSNKEKFLEWQTDVFGKTQRKEIAIKEDLWNYELW